MQEDIDGYTSTTVGAFLRFTAILSLPGVTVNNKK